MRGVLTDLGAAHILVTNNAGADDLDRVLGGAMATSHLHVHLGNGTAESRVSVLLVHVNSASAGEVTEDDAVVPDGTGLLLEDLARLNDFTLDLADLVLSLHLVPVAGPGENWVSGENTHSVEGWVRGRLSGEGTTHDVKLSNLKSPSPKRLDEQILKTTHERNELLRQT